MTEDALANGLTEPTEARNAMDEVVMSYPSPLDSERAEVRAGLFNLFLHGQLQFWRKDGDWVESPAGTTRVMGDVHYALAPNSAVDVNSWFMWHGEGL
ncbi:MAG: hypothetical protein H0W42_11585 [Gemmatimonadaceae bacterium]|nr:hypothetical protein [Gemmatimonadaceae bacterium]